MRSEVAKYIEWLKANQDLTASAPQETLEFQRKLLAAYECFELVEAHQVPGDYELLRYSCCNDLIHRRFVRIDSHYNQIVFTCAHAHIPYVVVSDETNVTCMWCITGEK